MINVDFSTAISAFFIFVIVILMGSWIFCEKKGKWAEFSDMKFLRQCPVCIHLFFDYSDEGVCVCPRCNSYLKKEEVQLR